MTPGQEYLVPCVRYAGMDVPVHLPAHRDPDLGEPRRHVHLDLRCLDLDLYRRHLLTHAGQRSDLFSTLLLVMASDAFLLNRLFFQLILVGADDSMEPRLVVCRRLMPEYPERTAGWLAPGPFVDSFTGHKPRNNRCPHKGLPLVRQADGRLRCPGHGLCFAACDG